MGFYIYLRGCDALRKKKTEGASEISEALFIHMPTQGILSFTEVYVQQCGEQGISPLLDEGGNAIWLK